MKNRREFLKIAGLAGAGMVVGQGQAQPADPFPYVHKQQFNMHGYAAPKLDRVRMGFIGVGSRGSGTVRRMANIEGVEIKAVCDLIPGNVKKVIEDIKGAHNPDGYSGSEDIWKEVCDRDDIDLIYIATPWDLHAPISIRSMERDKHVYTELPLATTVEECWQVVETSERTRKHCFMGSGSCHDGMSAVA